MFSLTGFLSGAVREGCQRGRALTLDRWNLTGSLVSYACLLKATVSLGGGMPVEIRGRLMDLVVVVCNLHAPFLGFRAWGTQMLWREPASGS